MRETDRTVIDRKREGGDRDKRDKGGVWFSSLGTGLF